MKTPHSLLIASLVPLLMVVSACSNQSSNLSNEIADDPAKKIADLNGQARINMQNGELEKALNHYKILSRTSKSSSAYSSEGNLLMTLGRFEEALAVLKKACDEDPDESRKSYAICDYIFCLTALKRYEEALEHIEKCQRQFDQYNDFVSARAVCLLALNRNEEALLRLEQFCRDNGDPEARIYYLRAVALKRLKREAESKRILNIATLIYPHIFVMKSGKRIAPTTTPLYADCAEIFLLQDKPERVSGTIALAEVLGESSLRMTVLNAIAQSKLNKTDQIAKAETLIETERHFWDSLSKR